MEFIGTPSTGHILCYVKFPHDLVLKNSKVKSQERNYPPFSGKNIETGRW